MRGRHIFAQLFCVFILAACAVQPSPVAPTRQVIPVSPAPLPDLPAASISHHPASADYRWSDTPGVPKYDPNSKEPFQIDLRSDYLANLDLSQSKVELLHADFDSQTQWPPADKMPADFDPKHIMETGKNPGLGVRQLHAKGITGRGVGIAIIDQTLLVDHIEYKDQLRLYEEGDYLIGAPDQAQMHGPAVASIAVGKTVGVAPGADLYFIGSFCFDGANVDFTCWAKQVRRVLEINKQLPAGRKIRVLSLSIGWLAQNKGYQDIQAAVDEVQAEGILVINSGGSAKLDQRFLFTGLDRDPLADPDLFTSYTPAAWWAESFFAGDFTHRLLMPMDSRTTASPTGNTDFVLYRQGGTSWVAPYLAGMYALALQVKPDLTPQDFWKLAFETGRSVTVKKDGKVYTMETILDPQALIANLQE